MRFLIFFWFVLAIGLIKHSHKCNVKCSIWNSIKQHSSENSCACLASPMILLTNISAAGILCACVYFYMYIQCVCVHITVLLVWFSGVNVTRIHNLINHQSKHFLAAIQESSQCMMNQFSKSVNYPFKFSSQGTCQLRVWDLQSLGWRLMKPFCGDYVQTRLVSSKRRRRV